MSSVLEARKAVDFDAFYRVMYPRIGKAMYLLTGSKSDADDLAQEALVRVCERWTRVSQMDAPEGYVFTIAMNLFRRWAGEAGQRHPLTFEPIAKTDEYARLEVLSALSNLTPSEREALVVVAWLGFSIDEAARILGVTPGAVRVRLHRGRKELHAQLGDDDG